MVREFKVSVDMDRFVEPQITPEQRQVLLGEVNNDNKLLAHLRRARVCGCSTCQAQAKAARWQTRGSELPQDPSGLVLDPFLKGLN